MDPPNDDLRGQPGRKESGSAPPRQGLAPTASIRATQAQLNLVLRGLSQDEAGKFLTDLNRPLIMNPAQSGRPLRLWNRSAFWPEVLSAPVRTGARVEGANTRKS